MRDFPDFYLEPPDGYYIGENELEREYDYEDLEYEAYRDDFLGD